MNDAICADTKAWNNLYAPWEFCTSGGVALIDIESESFSHWVWNYFLTVNYRCISCMQKYKAMVYSTAMKGANWMRSSFYCSSLCLLGIQGLLLWSLFFSGDQLLCTSERMSRWQCGDAWWSRLIFFSPRMNWISLLKSNEITRVW